MPRDMEITSFPEDAGALAQGLAEPAVGPSHFLLLWKVPRLGAQVPLAIGVPRKSVLVWGDRSLPALGTCGIFSQALHMSAPLPVPDTRPREEE